MVASKQTSNLRPLIIGIGNDMRGDDAVGCEVARRLAKMASANWDVCHAEDEALALMEAWQEREAVIIVDATQAAGSPGKIQRLDPTIGPLNSIMNDVSSHGLGLGYSLELARSLGKMPVQCLLFVIEGIDFSTGADISPEVEKVIPKVINEIMQEAEKIVSGGDMR